MLYTDQQRSIHSHFAAEGILFYYIPVKSYYTNKNIKTMQ